MKRKRKNACPSPLLDDSPKRTKVHAQRKFAQGSNVNSPVITPIQELESESCRSDILPEPVELLPIKRPNTEDFLTFLCFRGTPILPPSLNFFNTASIVDTNGQVHEIKSESSQKNGPIDITKCGTSSDKPFIAFGVRKRADPIVISRQMDKKRRHALAIQALRRKYQEQKMAKIRALTISKLSEKVTNRTLVKTNTVSKTETVTKKTNSMQKTKVIATKHVKVTTQTLKTTMRPKISQKMCLRSFRGLIVPKELPFIKRVGAVKNVVRKTVAPKNLPRNRKEMFSETEDKPKQQSSSKNLKKETIVGSSSRVTRSGQLDNKAEVRRKQIRKRILRLTTVKKTVVSQRKSRSIKAKKRLRTAQKQSVPDNNLGKDDKKDMAKTIDPKTNSKKLFMDTKKALKQTEKKDTLQVNKKNSAKPSDSQKEAENSIDIKKNFKKDYKRESKEIMEKNKKQVNKRVDIKKEISKSADIKKNPKKMVETKKSIRISNIIQRKETKNANKEKQGTSEDHKRKRRVHEEKNKNRDMKTPDTHSDIKIQKRSTITRKIRGQSEEEVGISNKPVDVECKLLKKDKLKVVCEKQKYSKGKDDCSSEIRTTKAAVQKLNIGETVEEVNKMIEDKGKLAPDTTEDSKEEKSIPNSESGNEHGNKSKLKKKIVSEQNEEHSEGVEEDRSKLIPQEIKISQALSVEIQKSESEDDLQNKSKSKKKSTLEKKNSIKLETEDEYILQHESKLKKQPILEKKSVKETDIHLKVVENNEMRQDVEKIEDVKKIVETLHNSDSEDDLKSISKLRNKTTLEKKKVEKKCDSNSKLVENELIKPFSNKIMNLKEVVDAILESKDSDDSENDTNIMKVAKKIAIEEEKTVDHRTMNACESSLFNVESIPKISKQSLEIVDIDIRPEDHTANLKKEESLLVHENIENLKCPDIDLKIFSNTAGSLTQAAAYKQEHFKIRDTKEIVLRTDIHKKSEIGHDQTGKPGKKKSKEEMQELTESQKGKKVTCVKEKVNDMKTLLKLSSKKRTKTKSYRKESTEEIEELNNITDKMRKLDTRTTDISIEGDNILREKSSVKNLANVDDQTKNFKIKNKQNDLLPEETLKNIVESGTQNIKMKEDTGNSMKTIIEEEIKSGKKILQTVNQNNDKFTAVDNINIDDNREENNKTAQNNKEKKFQISEDPVNESYETKTTNTEKTIIEKFINLGKKLEKNKIEIHHTKNLNIENSEEKALKQFTEVEAKILENEIETAIKVDHENMHEKFQDTKRPNLVQTAHDIDRMTTESIDSIIEIETGIPIIKTVTEKLQKDLDMPRKQLILIKSRKEVSKKDEVTPKKERLADKKTSMSDKEEYLMPKMVQRPSRKTKEAATIYMEILSHKLGQDSRIDDDNISIDSFPELPNVKKTEQRENELKKAQAKTSKDEKTENVTIESSHEMMNVEDIPDDIKLNDLKHRLQNIKKLVAPRRKSISKSRVQDQQFSDSDEIDIKTLISRMSEEKVEETDKDLRQTEEKVLPKRQSRNVPQTYRAEDSYDSDESFYMEVKVPRQKKFTRSNAASKLTKTILIDVAQEKSNPSMKLASSKAKSSFTTSSDESTTSDVNLQVLANKAKNKKFSKTKSVKKINLDFSDSDEEPLSKLTVKSVEGSQKSVIPLENRKDETSKASSVRKSPPSPLAIEVNKPEAKPKRECAKIPQNYLPMFSSSDEEDIFHGFDEKTEKSKPLSVLGPSCSHTPPLLDLLNKDLNRRFGKEKVNMSNEQIEKWLKDSALAGSSIKKENDDMLKFGEKITNEISKTDKPPTKPDTAEDNSKLASPESTPAVSDSSKLCDVSKPLLDRKLIFRKNKKASAPNINAFSPENESSVYAFGEENEDVISTPFRRPSRRPSSTATSRSEDESSKYEETLKIGQFRKPSLKQEPCKIGKDESDPILETEENTFYIPQNPSKHCLSKFQNKTLLKISKSNEKLSESDDFKYKIPSSPSASSSSSTKLYKRQNQKQKPKPPENIITPVYVSDFPKKTDPAILVEAPIFHPTEQEFQDPLEYIERIRHKAEQFGICRIVPPSTFKPECKVTDDMRFTAYNQYVHKMLHRWGPNFKELMAIKKYLETQNISLVHPPWIGGMEIDLPKLYQTVQTLGGLKEVIEKKKWPRVSELMKIPKSAQDRVTKLDDIYCKYLLPYDTLSIAEREKLFDEVETEWAKRESKSLMKSQQKSPNPETTDNDSDFEDDADECITKGRNMALNAFYRIARNTMSMYFKTNEPSAQEVEQEYWKYVTQRQNHICVNSGSIDSGNWGYGFAVAKNSPFARHPWNLKVLTNNSGSLLRSIAPLMAVTVPTLHVGMVFSACCWYRDPHGLPWIEYLHTGGNKIWYGIPDSTSDLFRSTLQQIAPNYCKDKELWLPSDTVMVPPALLVENGVSSCRTVQEPGQFVVVFPKAFTSCLSTGYTVSESVYFAPVYWLKTAGALFDSLRNSCEPSMFSLDRLLVSIANDSRCNADILRQVAPFLQGLCDREAERRGRLGGLGAIAREKLPLPEVGKSRKRKLQAGEEGDYECDICRMSLFVSMIFDTVEGINYCLDHGIEMLEATKAQLPNCKFMFTYDDQELSDLPNRIRTMIENKCQKKIPNKYAGMPTLLTK